MILLDTNVVSELMKVEPEPVVRDWFWARARDEMFASAISEAELFYGAAIMPAGRRRTDVTSVIQRLVTVQFAGRILPFDSDAARAFALLAADRRRRGRPISDPDAQIAAIAGSRNAVLATRNVRDFLGCGIEVINPWTVSPLPISAACRRNRRLRSACARTARYRRSRA